MHLCNHMHLLDMQIVLYSKSQKNPVHLYLHVWTQNCWETRLWDQAGGSSFLLRQNLGGTIATPLRTPKVWEPTLGTQEKTLILACERSLPRVSSIEVLSLCKTLKSLNPQSKDLPEIWQFVWPNSKGIPDLHYCKCAHKKSILRMKHRQKRICIFHLPAFAHIIMGWQNLGISWLLLT